MTKYRNPDAYFAKISLSKARVAHGMLGAAGLTSAVRRTKRPGQNTIYLAQETKFVAPVKIGDTITVDLVKMVEKPNILRLKTTVRNQAGKVVIGELALVKRGKADFRQRGALAVVAPVGAALSPRRTRRSARQHFATGARCFVAKRLPRVTYLAV